VPTLSGGPPTTDSTRPLSAGIKHLLVEVGGVADLADHLDE